MSYIVNVFSVVLVLYYSSCMHCSPFLTYFVVFSIFEMSICIFTLERHMLWSIDHQKTNEARKLCLISSSFFLVLVSFLVI